MNINKQYKLEELTVDKKDNRTPLESIYVYQNGQTWAVATNGKALAKVPVTVEADELKQGNSIKGTDLKFNRSNPNTKKLDNVFVSLEPISSQFPDVDKVFPKVEVIATIGIDIDLLYALSKAIGTNIVKLDIFEKNLPIKVSSTKDEAHGLICPISLKDGE